MHNRLNAVTLIEVLIALVLLSIIVLGIANIDFFSHFHVISADRRAKLQNEASLALEHMTKKISKAIGNEVIYGADSVVRININPNDVLMRIYIDASGNGQREPDPGNNPPSTVDHWIAYRYDSTGAPSNRNQIRYCGRCRNDNCIFGQCMDPVEIIGKNITSFTPRKLSNPLQDNYTTLGIQACWDPTGTCATPNNPAVTLDTTIRMPLVSTN